METIEENVDVVQAAWDVYEKCYIMFNVANHQLMTAQKIYNDYYMSQIWKS